MDDLTTLPADVGDLPLDDPSYIGGPVVVDFETGEVHEAAEPDPPLFAGLLGTMAQQNADMPEPVPYANDPWLEHAPPPTTEVD
jgi:hypothetical protein